MASFDTGEIIFGQTLTLCSVCFGGHISISNPWLCCYSLTCALLIVVLYLAMDIAIVD